MNKYRVTFEKDYYLESVDFMAADIVQLLQYICLNYVLGKVEKIEKIRQ